MRNAGTSSRRTPARLWVRRKAAYTRPMTRLPTGSELPAPLLEWRQVGEWHTHRGHRVFFRRAGDWSQKALPVLLLLHGFPTASWDWQPVWAPLCSRFRVLAPDFIGFGFSDKPRRYPYSIIDQAELAEAILDALGATTCRILAHDYGDSVAQELIARALDRQRHGLRGVKIESVVFLNGGLFPEAQRPRPIQKLLASPIGPALSRLLGRKRFGRSFRAVFSPKHAPSDEDLDVYWALVSHKGGHRLAHRLIRYLDERKQYRERWGGALIAATMPIRFIVGMVDPVSGAPMAARYRELVPQADVVELANVGHYPQLEAPEAVLEGCGEFWKRHV
jgi:pimeloyl-ACP methyl ester carboxylesterase